MQSFKDYYEDVEADTTAVIAFGRYNPPSTGHQLLIDKVSEVAMREAADGFIVPTHSSGNSSNSSKKTDK